MIFPYTRTRSQFFVIRSMVKPHNILKLGGYTLQAFSRTSGSNLSLGCLGLKGAVRLEFRPAEGE